MLFEVVEAIAAVVEAKPDEPLASASTGREIPEEPAETATVVNFPDPGRPLDRQLELFPAEVVDMRAYRSGPMPPELCNGIRAEIRRRGITQAQAAAEIGISRPQLCNGLKGRFGFSLATARAAIRWVKSGEVL